MRDKFCEPSLKGRRWGNVYDLWSQLYLNLTDKENRRDLVFIRDGSSKNLRIETPEKLLAFHASGKNARRPHKDENANKERSVWLGPVLRLAVIGTMAEAEASCVSRAGFELVRMNLFLGSPFSSNAKSGDFPLHLLHPGSSSRLEWIKNWTDKPNPCKHTPDKMVVAFDLCLRFVNQVLRAGKRPLTPNEIWEAPFCGPAALQDFVDLVMGNPGRGQAYKVPNAFLSRSANDSRTGTFAHMMDWITQDDQKDDQILRNIYSPNMRRALSSFGNLLADKANRKLRGSMRCIYLPLLPTAEPGIVRLPHQIGSVDFLAILEHFYTHPNPTAADVPKVEPSASFDSSLARVREAMIDNPLAIILDGVNVIDGDNKRQVLERFVDGNTVLGVILRLLEAPLAQINNEEALRRFQRNRVLVLSNAPIVANATLGKQGAALSFFDNRANNLNVIELEHPNVDDGEEIIKSHGLQYESAILGLRAQQQRIIDRFFDPEYHALDGFFGMASLNGSDATTINVERLISRINDPKSPEMLDLVLEELLKTITVRNRLLRGLLFLLTLTPDGLRRSTLLRSVEYHLFIQGFQAKKSTVNEAASIAFCVTPEDIAEYRQNLPKREQGWSLEETVGNAVDTILRLLSSILHKTAGDYVPGVDDGADGLELYESETSWRRRSVSGDGDDGTYAIGFVVPEIRVAMQRVLLKKFQSEFSEHTYRVACRVLSLIALRQQAMVFRHDGIAEGQMMRPWRRQVTAILLGLQSLPISIVRDNHGDALKPAQVQIDTIYDHLFQNASIQYDTSERFYNWLYFFAYRRQMESDGAHFLNRMHGMNSFKAHLLDSFEQPWLLTEDYFPKGEFVQDANLFASIHSSADKALGIRSSEDVIIQHLLARIATDTSNGNRKGADEALKNLWQLYKNPDAVSHEDFKIRFKVMRRRIDIGILDKENDRAEKIIQDILLWATGKRARHQGSGHESSNWPAFLMGDVAFASLREIITVIAQLFYNHATDDQDHGFDRVQLVSILNRIEEEVLLKLSGSWEPYLRTVTGLSDLSDILFRLAELIKQHTDEDNQHSKPPRKLPASVSQIFFDIDLVFSHPPRDYSEHLQRRCVAMAVFQIAEKMRLLTFERAPTSNNFFASGHSMREMIDLARFLENQRRFIVNTATRDVPETGYSKLDASVFTDPESGDAAHIEDGFRPDPIFVRLARDCSLALSRHLFRFPGERGAMMLMEAAILRMMVRRPSKFDNPEGDVFMLHGRALTAARFYIAKAEETLLSRGSNSRRRLRLSLERCIVHMDLARLHARKREMSEVAFYLQLAKADLLFLKSRITSMSLRRNWQRILLVLVERFAYLSLLTEEVLGKLDTLLELVFPDEAPVPKNIALHLDDIRICEFDLNTLRAVLPECEHALETRKIAPKDLKKHGKAITLDILLSYCSEIQKSCGTIHKTEWDELTRGN